MRITVEAAEVLAWKSVCLRESVCVCVCVCVCERALCSVHLVKEFLSVGFSFHSRLSAAVLFLFLFFLLFLYPSFLLSSFLLVKV